MGNQQKSNYKDLKKKNFNLDNILRPNSNLNIFLLGKNEIDEQLLKIFNFRQKKDYEKKDFHLKYNIYVQENRNRDSKWEFYEFAPITVVDSKNIKNFVEEKINNGQKQNVIIYINNRNDDNDYELINQLSDIENSSHPFIIFITKNHDKNNYDEFIIENEIKKGSFYYDSFNIYAIDYKQYLYFIEDKEIYEKENLIIILWKIYSYYYQIDYNKNINEVISQNECCLNIYIIGQPGSGKSTFINELFHEKKALENTGMNQTTEVRKYTYIFNDSSLGKKQKQMINLIDCPGFSTSGQELNKLKEEISNIFTQYASHKDLIHCFLYFFDGRKKRTFDGDEKAFVNSIHRLQHNIFGHSKIFFIINFVNKTEENDKNSFKNMLYRDLIQDFKNSDINSDIINKENIIEINLKRDIKENRKIRFGIDDIFNKMFEYFRQHKINIEEIRDIQNKSNLNNKEKLDMQIQNIKKSLFFKFFQRNDFLERNLSICENIITSAKRDTERIGYFLFKSDIIGCENIRRRMFEEINEHFNNNFNIDIRFYFNDYRINDDEFMDESAWSKLSIIKYFYHAKKMKENCPLITERKGRFYFEDNKNRLGEKEKSNVEHLLTLAELYNNSVNLLHSIGEQQKQKYDFEIKYFESIKKVIKIKELTLTEYEKTIKEKTPKFDIKNNQFLVILNIEEEHPDIEVKVIVVDKYYVFKIIINGKEITFSKSIEEIQLNDKHEVKEVVKGEKENEYIFKFDLKDISSYSSKKFKF